VPLKLPKGGIIIREGQENDSIIWGTSKKVKTAGWQGDPGSEKTKKGCRPGKEAELWWNTVIIGGRSHLFSRAVRGGAGKERNAAEKS